MAEDVPSPSMPAEKFDNLKLGVQETEVMVPESETSNPNQNNMAVADVPSTSISVPQNTKLKVGVQEKDGNEGPEFKGKDGNEIPESKEAAKPNQRAQEKESQFRTIYIDLHPKPTDLSREPFTKQNRIRLLDRDYKFSYSDINVALYSLTIAFPEVGGLQIYFLSMLPPEPTTKEIVIQIINTDPYGKGEHWMVFYKKGKIVHLYDSDLIPGEKVQIEVTMAMAEMLQLTGLVINKMPCSQQKKGSVDCGVYAIAFATALAYGHDPSKIKFAKGELLREHFDKCIQKGEMKPFPIDDSGALDSEITFEEVALCKTCHRPKWPMKNVFRCRQCECGYNFKEVALCKTCNLPECPMENLFICPECRSK